MKKLVLSFLLLLSAAQLTAASFNEPIAQATPAMNSRAESLDEWFADYDMYCKTLNEFKASNPERFDRALISRHFQMMVDENSRLTERLVALKTRSGAESQAREQFFSQLRLERASMVLQIGQLEKRSASQGQTVHHSGPLLAKASQSRDQALRALASVD